MQLPQPLPALLLLLVPAPSSASDPPAGSSILAATDSAQGQCPTNAKGVCGGNGECACTAKFGCACKCYGGYCGTRCQFLKGELNDDECGWLEWLEGQQVSFGATELAYADDDMHPGDKVRSLMAKRDLDTGESAFSMPLSAVLTPETARNSSISFVFAENPALFQTDMLVLILYLMHLKIDTFGAEAAKWQPWLRVMPTTFPTTTEFSAEEMQYVAHTSMALDTRKRLEEMEGTFKALFPLLSKKYPTTFPARVVSYSIFHWCWLVVQTRGFYVHLGPATDPSNKMLALIPLGDMLNHGGTPLGWSFDKNLQRLNAFAQGPVIQTQQLWNLYGQMSNSELMVTYGFSEPENMWDAVYLTSALNPNADEWQYRNDSLWIQKVVHNKRGEVLVKVLEGELSRTLIKHSRILSFTERELLFWDPWLNSSLTLRSEAATVQKYRSVCKKQMDLFTTTIDQDTDLIGKNIGTRARNAVVARRGEKQVLATSMQLVDSLSPFLEYLTPEWTDVNLNFTDVELMKKGLSSYKYVKQSLLPLLRDIADKGSFLDTFVEKTKGG